jgi:hypothetical protein
MQHPSPLVTKGRARMVRIAHCSEVERELKFTGPPDGGAAEEAAGLLEGIGGADFVHAPGDGDASLAEDVGNLGLAQARSIVFEGEAIFLVVDAKSAQAVGVRKITETLKLFRAQG